MLFETLQHQDNQAMTIWVVLTDGERIRILEIVDANEPQEVNTDNLVKVETDRKAMHEAFVPGNQEYEQSETVMANAESAVVDFSQTISSHLEEARQLGLFDQLIVVAPSEILNTVIDSLTTEVREVLILEMETDLIDADTTVIRASLPV